MKILNGQIYCFEDVEVDPSRRCLRRGGVELEVRQKSLQALLFLLAERHRLVTKEELMADRDIPEVQTARMKLNLP